MADIGKHDYLIPGIKEGESVEPYAHSERAARVYSHWMAGFTEDEIAHFFEIPEVEVKLDLQYMQASMSPRQIIAHNNDRARILLQRSESDQYRRMIKDAMAKPIDEYFAAGLSPVGVMREYREATGMTEKPGGISLSFTKNTANIYGAGAIGGAPVRGMEDIVRAVLAAQPERRLQPVTDVPLDAIAAASDADAEGGESPEEETE